MQRFALIAAESDIPQRIPVVLDRSLPVLLSIVQGEGWSRLGGERH